MIPKYQGSVQHQKDTIVVVLDNLCTLFLHNIVVNYIVENYIDISVDTPAIHFTCVVMHRSYAPLPSALMWQAVISM